MSASSISSEPAAATGSAMTGTATTRGRANWSGLLQVSLITIPVKAYPASSTSQQVHFNQLHADCGQRIRYEKHCPRHGKVEAGAIVSGYAYAPDQYVVIDQAELEPLRPAKERALCLECFCDPRDLDPALYSGRTLYLLPDGLAAQHAYAVLSQTLVQRRKWAVGRVVLGGHRVLVSVRPSGPLLALHVLHYPEYLRAAEALPALAPASAASPEEQHLAGMLIDAATRPIPWADYRDDTAEQLRILIEAKLQGRTPAAPVTEEIPILQLVDALKRSVAQALGRQADASPANETTAVEVPPVPTKKRAARKMPNRRSA